MRTITALLLAALIAPLAAHAEKPNTPPAAMRKSATNVIVGRVKTIYQRVTREGGYRVTRYVAEIDVVKDEKGDLAKGALAYVRYWDREWVSGAPMPTNTSGHRGLPKEGETLRIYAINKGSNGFDETTDGGLDVYGASGFERIQKEATK